MDLRETLARMKPLMGPAVLLGTVGAWLLVFQSGWQSSDWAGFWSDATEVRGDVVDTTGKRVETPLEREKRLGIESKHVNETLYKAKKKLLGERDKTRGNDIEWDRGDVPNMYRSTEREACYEMRLEFPDRYKDVDCMSTELSDEPWLPGAPPAYVEEDDTPAAKPGATPLDTLARPDPMAQPDPLARPDPMAQPDPLARPDPMAQPEPTEAQEPPAWLGNMRKSPLGTPDPPAEPPDPLAGAAPDRAP